MNNDFNLEDNDLTLDNDNDLSLDDNGLSLDDDSIEYSGLSLDDNNLSLNDAELSLEDTGLSLNPNTSSTQGNSLNKMDLTSFIPKQDGDLPLEDNELPLEDDSLSVQDNELSLEDSELSLEDNELSLEDSELPLEDNQLSLEDDGFSLEDDEILVTGTELVTNKLRMGTSTTEIDDDDELVLYDDDPLAVQEDEEEEESIEEKEEQQRINALEKRQKAQKRYRRSGGSIAESRDKIISLYEEFYGSYEGYFEQLEFSDAKKDKIPDLVQYGEVTKLSPLVREWSGNIISTFRGKIEDAISNNQEYKVKDLMELTLKEVNINKAYEMPHLVYVKDLFVNEIEYNDYTEFLNRYKLDRELMYATGNKDRINKLALKTKYKEMYFPIIDNIRSAIQEIVTYEDPDTQLTFVEKMNIDDGTFICGHCGEESDMEVPFYDFYFLPEGGEKGEIGVVMGGMNKCDYCNKYNILSAEELKALNRLFTQNKLRILDNLGEFIRTRRQSSFGFAKYSTAYTDIIDSIPSLIEHDELEDDIVEELTEVPDLTKAILRYKELLDYFSGLKYVSSSSVSRAEEVRKAKEELAIEHKEPGAELGRYFEEVGVVKPDIIHVVSEHDIEKYEVIAKLMCSVVSVDYNERKLNAINSLINHLQSSKYGRYLRYSDFISLYAISQSKGIIDELKELEGTEFMTLAMDCYSSLATGKKYTDLDKQPRAEIIKNVEEGFAKVDKELSRYLELREIYMRDIRESMNDLSQIYIANNAVSDDIKEDYLLNDDVRMLLDMLANRMIMNDTSEDFFQAWFTSYRHDSNKSMNKVSRNKSFTDIKDFTGNSVEFLEKLEKILENMDSHKGKKFKHARFIQPSVYPDTDTSQVLDKFLKLKLKMDIDEYETLIVLNDILNNTQIRNRVLNKYLGRLMKDCGAEIQHIVTRYGTDRISRLKYYFEGIFTSDEIEKDYDEYMDYIRINRIIERLPNENFKSYMERYKDLAKGDYNYTIRDTALLEKLRESYVFIDACNVISSTVTDVGTTRKVEFKVAMNTILNALLAHYNKDDIIDILGYEPFIINGLLNNIEPKDFYTFQHTYSEFMLILRASSYLYNNQEINAELSDAGLDVSRLETILRRYAGELEAIGSHIKNIGDVHELITS